MGVLKDKFIKDYNLVASGGKGWMVSHSHKGLYCPQCKHNDSTRLAFAFSEKRGIASFHCVKCNFSCRLEKFLWIMKLPQYIQKFKEVKQEDILEKKSLIKEQEQLKIEELPEVSLPLLFQRLKYSKYLQSRGASLEIYKRWVIGKTDFEDELKDYIIFVIPENNIYVGWVARSQKSKKEIDEYNKSHERKILRWRNSQCDFGKIVFGLDEITENTKELIIVEGITSKLRIDCELQLYNKEERKCCCTFGKKTTDIQLQKIKNKSINVEKLILFYDSDAILQAKKTAYQYKELFDNVKIAFCNFKNEEGEYKDAGDLNKEELLFCLNNLESPFEFFNNKMQKKSLLKK